jgi:hypothetical protein
MDRRMVCGISDSQLFDISTRQCSSFFPPFVGREIQIGGPDEIADSAAFVGILNAFPNVLEFVFEGIGLVSQDYVVGQ